MRKDGQIVEKSHTFENGGSKNGAIFGKDVQLCRVIELWPALSAKTRLAIIALIGNEMGKRSSNVFTISVRDDGVEIPAE